MGIKVGVAWLDDPKMSGEDTSGWASSDGGNSFRFSHFSELESDTLWISNAEYEAAKSARHYTVHNLRGEGFLGSYLSSILTDLYPSDRPTNNVAAQQLSAIASRTCRFAVKSYGAKVLSESSLTAGIQEFLKPKTPQLVQESRDPWMTQIMVQAWQKHASCQLSGQRFIRSARRVAVRANRLSHAVGVMQTRIPEGVFEHVEDESALSVDRLLSQDRPFLAQVSVSKVVPEVSEILSFGSSFMSRRGRPLREWVSTPELMLLSRFSLVKVRSAIFWERSGRIPEPIYLPDSFDDDLMVLSYSAGLVAEAHVSALMNGEKMGGKDGVMLYSPMAVFLSAMDRVLTFPLARALRNEGYPISRYGAGSVFLMANTSMLRDLSGFVKDAGLSFPLPEVVGKAA